METAQMRVDAKYKYVSVEHRCSLIQVIGISNRLLETPVLIGGHWLYFYLFLNLKKFDET